MQLRPLVPVALAFAFSAALAAACGQDGQTTTGPSSSSTGGSSSSAGGSGGATTGGGGTSANGGAGGAGGGGGFGGVGGDIDKSANCADTFGSALTAPYGRIDGTVLSIVKPEDTQCTGVNNDHVVVEVVMNGDVYRMVVNVLSDFGPPDVYFLEKAGALPAPAWSEGWHVNAPLDYVNDLGAHSTDFTAYDEQDLANIITHRLDIGAKVSFYAGTDGGDSAHLVHKNAANHDGAIVIDVDTADPKFLLFHFDEQVF